MVCYISHLIPGKQRKHPCESHHIPMKNHHICCAKIIIINITRSILHGYLLILTSLLVLMGISTFTSKEFVIFCRVSRIGNINITLWLFNIAMEHDPFIDDFPIKPSIYEGFSMAMLNNQRVSALSCFIMIYLSEMLIFHSYVIMIIYSP